jgi:hypothetical protein
MVMADFSAALLGGTVTGRVAGEATLEASGRLIHFRAAPGYRPPTWLLRLGGSMAAHQDASDPDLLVMLDPAGHPFCLIRSSAAEGY